jgi:dihydropyrimidine dehydrogenase (NADP+)
LQKLPNFGPYREERDAIINQKKLTSELLDEKITHVRPVNPVKKSIPGVKDMIGLAVPRIGTYNDLNNKEQVVALIDEVRIGAM